MIVDWNSFLMSLAGGAVIGLSASLLLALNGRVAGISGILGGLLLPKPGEVTWRAFFLGGLLAGGAAVAMLAPGAIGASPRSLGVVVAAGALVGIGTRIGNGCTSGHGICGLSRLSVRSLAAVVTFLTTGALTAVLFRTLGGAQ